MSDVMENVREVLSRPCADCGITPALVLWQDKETRLCRSCSSIRHGHTFETSPSFHAFMEELNSGDYRQVEIVGGPEDGKVYAVKRDLQDLTIRQWHNQPHRWNASGPLIDFDTLTLPIQRTADGRHIIQWPED